MRTPRRAGWMRRNARGAFLLALALAGASRTAAAEERERHWFLQVAGGASTMQLRDVKDFYQQDLNFYRSNGIPIESQREFPANLIVGGDVLYGLPDDIRIGIGTRYTWSHAYALYGDFGGTLDVVGEVRLLAVQVVSQRVWSATGPWSPFVEVRAGRGWARIKVYDKLVLTQYATGEAQATLEGKGSAPLAELHIGMRNSRGHNFLIGTAGYRYCKLPGPPFDLDVSGFVTTLTVGRAIH